MITPRQSEFEQMFPAQQRERAWAVPGERQVQIAPDCNVRGGVKGGHECVSGGIAVQYLASDQPVVGRNCRRERLEYGLRPQCRREALLQPARAAAQQANHRRPRAAPSRAGRRRGPRPGRRARGAGPRSDETIASDCAADRHSGQRSVSSMSDVSVSVVVPAHNAEQTIAATLRSALAQEGPAIEVVVIDDGSRDHTATLVAEIAQADVRFVSTG